MSPSLDWLEARWGRTGAVTFAERYGGPVALLQAGGATAVVALQGAQVLSYVPPMQSEVLWLSPVAKLGTGKAVRGDVPVCWPWFGPHIQLSERNPRTGLCGQDLGVSQDRPPSQAGRVSFWHMTPHPNRNPIGRTGPWPKSKSRSLKR